MKKQIYLLSVALSLGLGYDVQASVSRLYNTARQAAPLISRYAVRPGGLPQGAIQYARQPMQQQFSRPGMLTTPAMRALVTQSTGDIVPEFTIPKYNNGYWKQFKNSSFAKWAAGAFAGGALTGVIYNAKPALAEEEESQNPHFQELLKREFGPTPGMIRANTYRLFDAIATGNIDDARDAIKKAGANIITNETNIYKDKSDYRHDKASPWTHAINKNNLTAIKLFIEQGVDINEPILGNLTPLNYAILRNSSDVARFLIKNGAYINGRDYFSKYINDDAAKTPLMNAASEHNIEMVNALLEAGADVNIWLHNAYSSTDALLEAIRRNAGRRDWPNNSSWTNNIAVVNALLKAEADVNSVDKALGNRPLHHAAFNGKTEIAQALINAKANVNIRNETNTTPLMYAAQRGALDTLQVLLKAGAIVNHRDKFGRTALWEAAYGGKLDVAQRLIDAGADINIKDSHGKTALDVAKQERDCINSKSYMSEEKEIHNKELNSVIDLLKQRGAK